MAGDVIQPIGGEDWAWGMVAQLMRVPTHYDLSKNTTFQTILMIMALFSWFSRGLKTFLNLDLKLTLYPEAWGKIAWAKFEGL